MPNGIAESFNGRMCDKRLNETMFRNLAHARVVIAACATDYNTGCLTCPWTTRPLPITCWSLPPQSPDRRREKKAPRVGGRLLNLRQPV